MSDTPRTDAVEYQVFDDYNCAVNVVNSALARQLERELAESREQEKIHYDNFMSVQAERDRLAEALREIHRACMDKTIETRPDEHTKGTIDDCIETAEQAIAAVKEGSHE
jgi:hypothetical protein